MAASAARQPVPPQAAMATSCGSESAVESIHHTCDSEEGSDGYPMSVVHRSEFVPRLLGDVLAAAPVVRHGISHVPAVPLEDFHFVFSHLCERYPAPLASTLLGLFVQSMKTAIEGTHGMHTCVCTLLGLFVQSMKTAIEGTHGMHTCVCTLLRPVCAIDEDRSCLRWQGLGLGLRLG